MCAYTWIVWVLIACTTQARAPATWILGVPAMRKCAKTLYTIIQDCFLAKLKMVQINSSIFAVTLVDRVFAATLTTMVLKFNNVFISNLLFLTPLLCPRCRHSRNESCSVLWWMLRRRQYRCIIWDMWFAVRVGYPIWNGVLDRCWHECCITRQQFCRNPYCPSAWFPRRLSHLGLSSTDYVYCLANLIFVVLKDWCCNWTFSRIRESSTYNAGSERVVTTTKFHLRMYDCIYSI